MGLQLLLATGRGVTELALGTDNTGGLVTNWYGAHKIPLSDHRYIIFKVGDPEVTRLTNRSPQRNNWES
jgi:hypothetical protein